jgi:SAM-dependent methyltransferase
MNPPRQTPATPNIPPAGEPGPGIRTVDIPFCPVCGGTGAIAYTALEDRLFGAPGRWRMQRCVKNRCRTLWLDPAPHPGDLGLIYQSYYTHASSAHCSTNVLNDGCHQMWAAWRLGYPKPVRPTWRRMRKFMLDLREVERAEFFRFYLPWQSDGRVLDVGCGAGNELNLLRHLGWQAEGLEPDRAAVDAATHAALKVTQGDLLSHPFAPESFDAVTMSHVIEHLVDPKRHLREAWRLLRPGGRLVLLTPNANSWGHRHYGADWRGLEPPRHLQIFTLPSLKQTLRELDFDISRARTSARDAGYLLLFCENLRQGIKGPSATTVAPGTWPPANLRRIETREGWLARLGIPLGEELLVVARKRLAS